MAAKFMRTKKVVVPVMALIVLMSQLSGCAAVNAGELLGMINAGQMVAVELAKPDYEIRVQGKVEKPADWVQLDQLKTYNDLRLDFDTLLNINTITSNGVNGKSGCLYVNEAGETDGNTTLEDAFRNKVFVEKYWSDAELKSKLGKLSTSAYKDADGSKADSLYASLNAYYDLFPDNVDPSSFNSTQSVTREQFYAFEFKASNGVKALTNDDKYTAATGGKTDYSLYAQQDQKYAFLNTEKNCLDSTNAKGSISRSEAVYMVVNKYFPKELKAVTSKDKCYKDCKNAGDLALKAGFKEKKDGNIVGKKDWQTYTLAYMMQHPTKGMQEELYDAMVVAYTQGLLGAGVEESRWDEPISKAESLELMTNTFLALNKTQGFKSSIEYGRIVENRPSIGEQEGIVANAGQGPDVVLTPEEQEMVVEDSGSTGNSTSTVPSGSKPSGNTGKSSGGKSTGGKSSSGKTSGGSTSSGASSGKSSGSTSGNTGVDPGWGNVKINDHEYTREEADKIMDGRDNINFH